MLTVDISHEGPNECLTSVEAAELFELGLEQE